ncbi:MAG: hypothetical protein KGI41_00160 [Patescibacteria group bacterium]|nr:hypothetical protein [Patescibacteria group bacterium]MDE1965645.1 hypothetical protein [Patescibacteria group bacterium]
MRTTVVIGILFFSLLVGFAPSAAFACTTNAECPSGQDCNLNGQCVSYSNLTPSTPQNLSQLFQTLITLINDVVPLVFAIAFIAFLWGIFLYFIKGADDESKRETGREFILYAVIGFFVMFGIWGIVNVVNNTFGFNDQSKPSLPCFGNSSDCNTTQGG